MEEGGRIDERERARKGRSRGIVEGGSERKRERGRQGATERLR